MSVYFQFLRKEARDIRRNPQLLLLNLLLPVISVTLMLLFAVFSSAIVRADPNDPLVIALDRQVASLPEFAAMPRDVAFTVYTMRALLGFFLIMPVALSSTLAAYSVVGEKQQRTLEPILATPISDRELLIGKMLASLVPPLLLTWLAGVVAAVGSGIITWTRWHTIVVPDRYWLISLGVLAPLVGIASVLATMRMSARSTDPQTAVHTSAIFLVPGFLVLVSVVGKILATSVTAGLVAALLLALLDVWLFRHNVRRFAREEILTRWR